MCDASLYEQALEIRLKTGGEMDLGTAGTKTAIANVYYQNEEHDKALELYREVQDVQVRDRKIVIAGTVLACDWTMVCQPAGCVCS